jgi:hypothetical protein
MGRAMKVLTYLCPVFVSGISEALSAIPNAMVPRQRDNCLPAPRTNLRTYDIDIQFA